MGYCLVAALALAFLSLVAARYLDAPHWVDALLATGSCLGLSAALALGLLLRRVIRHHAWHAPAALVLALGAALGRGSLLGELAKDPMARVTIDFGRMALACSTVVWGLVALVWGALAVSDGVELFQQGSRKRAGLLGALGGAGAVTVALYSVAPLRSFFGITIDAYTLAGLFVLAAMAYGAGALWRRITARGKAK